MDYKVIITNYHMMLALINIRDVLEWGSSLIIWDESHKFMENNVQLYLLIIFSILMIMDF
jgi:hypothetical protein